MDFFTSCTDMSDPLGFSDFELLFIKKKPARKVIHSNAVMRIIFFGIFIKLNRLLHC